MSPNEYTGRDRHIVETQPRSAHETRINKMKNGIIIISMTSMWQTDFTYLKVISWGWMYLSTILDDYSRYIIAWKLCTTMKTRDVTDTLDLALQASGCDQAHVAHKPRLLSDNGSSYVSGELAEWLGDKKMGHVRGAPYHPQTQGKIERWHQTLKNRILLDNYFFPADLEA